MGAPPKQFTCVPPIFCNEDIIVIHMSIVGMMLLTKMIMMMMLFWIHGGKLKDMHISHILDQSQRQWDASLEVHLNIPFIVHSSSHSSKISSSLLSPSSSPAPSPSSSPSPNISLIIIIKLLKVWESGVIKGKILDHLKALCKHRRTLEEAARFKLFIKLEMNMRNSNRWTFPFMLVIL